MAAHPDEQRSREQAPVRPLETRPVIPVHVEEVFKFYLMPFRVFRPMLGCMKALKGEVLGPYVRGAQSDEIWLLLHFISRFVFDAAHK